MNKPVRPKRAEVAVEDFAESNEVAEDNVEELITYMDDMDLYAARLEDRIKVMTSEAADADREMQSLSLAHVNLQSALAVREDSIRNLTNELALLQAKQVAIHLLLR